MSTHLLSYFPIHSDWRNCETIVKRILRQFELKYKNEIYYNISYDRLIHIIKNIIGFVEDPLGETNHLVEIVNIDNEVSLSSDEDSNDLDSSDSLESYDN